MGNTPLKCLFPELFAVEIDKSCSIESRFSHSINGIATWRWSWSNANEAERMASKVGELENLLKHVVLRDGDDSWNWEGDPSGAYTVKSLRAIIDNLTFSLGNYICFWNK